MYDVYIITVKYDTCNENFKFIELFFPELQVNNAFILLSYFSFIYSTYLSKNRKVIFKKYFSDQIYSYQKSCYSCNNWIQSSGRTFLNRK